MLKAEGNQGAVSQRAELKLTQIQTEVAFRLGEPSGVSIWRVMTRGGWPGVIGTSERGGETST